MWSRHCTGFQPRHLLSPTVAASRVPIRAASIAASPSSPPSPSSTATPSSSALRYTAPVRRKATEYAVGKNRVAVVGSGRIGCAITHMLASEPGYVTRLCDAKPEVAAKIAAELPIVTEAYANPVTERSELRRALEGMRVVISAAPASANVAIAEVAAELNVHYVDMSEDMEILKQIQAIASRPNVKSSFVAQCGLAPGYSCILATHAVKQMERAEELDIRVGVLPEQPNNRLKYNLDWSVSRFKEEYIDPCKIISGGKVIDVQALSGREEVVIDGVTYEAFHTSQGMGVLCETLKNHVQHLTFKTLRYPGHLHLIRFLLDDLKFRDHLEELVKTINNCTPVGYDDSAIVSVRVLGIHNGKYTERTFWRKLGGAYLCNRLFSGLEIAAAATACSVTDLLLSQAITQNGFMVAQDVPYNLFMTSLFGKYYSRGDRNK